MLDRINTSRFDKGREQAQRGAKASLDIVIKYSSVFKSVKNGSKLLADAISMNKQKQNFTEKQLSYIDGIYEKWIGGLSIKGTKLESVPVKHDMVKTLRY